MLQSFLITALLSTFWPAHANFSNGANKCVDWLLAFKPKMGRPSFVGENFDVRIVGQYGRTSNWSNRDLLEGTVNRFEESRRRLTALGFRQQNFVHVLVARHPGAILITGHARSGPFVAKPHNLIEIPDILGFHRFFIGRLKKEDRVADAPLILALTTYSADSHSLFNSVPHEFAHATEPENSPNSRIWREARADFLDYAQTGKTERVFPVHPEIQAIAKDGEWMDAPEGTGRSLTQPQVEKLSDLLPNDMADHENSTLLSSLLFRLASRFDLPTAVRFTRYVDHLPRDTFANFSEAANKRGPEARREWQMIVRQIFRAMNDWSHGESADLRAWLALELLRLDDGA